jgi:hypothetical protein
VVKNGTPFFGIAIVAGGAAFFPSWAAVPFILPASLYLQHFVVNFTMVRSGFNLHHRVPSGVTWDGILSLIFMVSKTTISVRRTNLLMYRLFAHVIGYMRDLRQRSVELNH